MNATEYLSNLSPKLEALFFDFDGVIVQSLHIKANAFINLFENESQEHKDQIREMFYRDTAVARQIKLRHVFEHVLKLPYVDTQIEALAIRFGASCIEDVIQCPEVEGAEAFLKAVPDHIPCFVVSGTTETDLKTICENRRLSHYFESICGTPTAKDIHITNLVNQYGLNPENCLMFGDGIVDHRAAKKNHLNFMGIVENSDKNPFEDHIVTAANFNELIGALNSKI